MSHRQHPMSKKKAHQRKSVLARLTSNDRKELEKFSQYLKDVDALGRELADEQHAEFLGKIDKRQLGAK